MIDDELHTQAALYAAGALPADEAEAFLARLKNDAELAALVAEYEAGAAEFAESAPQMTPPAHLRKNILAAITPAAVVVESRRTSWLPWALAAGFAFATGLLWMQNNQLRTVNQGQFAAWTELTSELQAAKSRGEKADDALAALDTRFQELLKADGGKTTEIESLRKAVVDLQDRNAAAEMQVATLTSKLDASYLASVAWDKNSQEGVLHVRRLPVTERDKDYQLWVIDPKYSVPVSAGIFKVQSDGSATIHFSASKEITGASKFAVSVEKTGGAPSPQGPVVLSN
jgi:anti-sigma-K factor RskA